MNKRNEILFFVMVFILQLVISDYLHLGPWITLSLIPFLIHPAAALSPCGDAHRLRPRYRA